MESLQPALESIVGTAWVSSRFTDRIAYSRDLWPKHQLSQGLQEVAELPAFVVWPGSSQELSNVLRLCHEAEAAVCPIGGGSSVTGAATPSPGCVVLDTKRLRAIRSLDSTNGRIEVEAGRLGGDLEEALQQEDLTLGHFPSSLYQSSLGGWIATRCSGQASARYGNIEDLVLAIEWVTLEGDIHWTDGPWDATPLFLGSEGTLGLITACKLQVFPKPKARSYRGVLFPTLEEGLEAMQYIMQNSYPPPTVMRLYDPIDSLLSAHRKEKREVPLLSTLFTAKLKTEKEEPEEQPAMQPKPSLLQPLTSGLGKFVNQARQRVMGVLLRSSRSGIPLLDRLIPTQAMLLFGYEEQTDTLAEQRILETLREFETFNGKDMGEEVGEHWYKHRYDASFRQAQVFSSGAFTDTIDVATDWSQLIPLYRSVRAALERDAWVQAQFTHPYPDGCSVSFSFTVVDTKKPNREAYETLWRRGLSVVHTTPATMSHQNGIGRLKTKALVRELGPVESSLLKTVQECWQPATMCSSQKLLPPSIKSFPLSSSQSRFRPTFGSRNPSFEQGGLHIDTQSMLMQVGGFHTLEAIETFAQLHGLTAGFRTGWEYPLSQWFSQRVELAQRNHSVHPLSLCQSLSITLSSGETLTLGHGPRSSTGPDLRSLLWGSFDTIGTIHQATLRLQKQPSALHFGSYLFQSVEQAVETIRRMSQRKEVQWEGAILPKPSHETPTFLFHCPKQQFSLLRSYFPKGRDFKEYHSQHLLPCPDARMWLSVEVPWSDVEQAWTVMSKMSPTPLQSLSLLRARHHSGVLFVQLHPTIRTKQHYVETKRSLSDALTSLEVLQMMGSNDRWEDRCLDQPHAGFFQRLQSKLTNQASDTE